MRRLFVLLLIAVAVGLFGVSSLPRSSSALPTLPVDWDPLSATCYDVNGDGLVDLPNDILGVIQHFNTKWGEDEYALVYDVTGGGVVDLPNDVFGTILAFNPSLPSNCSDVDTQVIRAAAALLPYQDCQAAVADGYEGSGVWVDQMGIHISKYANLKTTFDPDLWDPVAEEWTDLANPFGLVCTEDPNVPNKPDNLIGAWYILPVASTANIYNFLPGVNVSPPYQSDTEPPVGFATGEDYIAYNPASPRAQAGWHTHINLCVGPGSLDEMGAGPWPNDHGHDPADPQHECQSHRGGIINFSLYGWMLHLYTFVPNPDGRFMRWNVNPDFPRCGYEPVTAPGGC